MNDGFEQRIVDALHSRATHVQVADRLDAIVDRPGMLRRLSPTQQRLSFIAAACMIAAIAGAGLRTATGAIPRPNVAASGGQAEERPTPVTTWTDDQSRDGAAAWIAILDGGGRASIDGGLDASVIVERLDTRCEAKVAEPALHEPPLSLASAEVAEAMSLVLGAVLCEVSGMSVHISADGSLAGVILTTSADKVREIQSLIGPHVDVQLDGAS